MQYSDRVTLRQIQCLVAVADHGSFRRAADQLEITQPTLTAQIAALEKTLGTQLFERTRSGSPPSATARGLLPNARRVLEETQAFMDQAHALTSGTLGTYRLGVTPTLGPYLLPAILPAIHAEFTGLKLYVREAPPADLEMDLREARHDVILTTEPVLSRELAYATLFREPVRLAIAREHRLATRNRISRSDLRGEEVLTIGEHHLFHAQILDVCKRVGASVRRDYEGTSLDALRQMVVMNMGLAFLPALYIRSEIRDREELRVADVQGLPIFRRHVLVWRATSPSRHLFKRLAQRIAQIAMLRLSEDIIPARE
ncbi:MAG: hydrogen peroxide-inducible genes activator [Pseudomonadales bacterium]|nr:hydrogen peroxide-inducible genes activator [Pseudomonadales bacterium]MCP5184970.1 hydrogen peroxide-inducible genes activator [Pseudomonadales bacterium]